MILSWIDRAVSERTMRGGARARVQPLDARSIFAGIGSGWLLRVAAVWLALHSVSAPVLAGAEPVGLTSDQQAIIDKTAKSSHGDNVQYAGAPTDPIGAE